jgi:hypothetical protein
MMVGDSPQALVVNLSQTDAETYITDRATNGFNTVLVDAICTTYTGGPANASLLNGTLPFTNTLSGGDYDLTTPNPAYFSYLDQIVSLAATNGIQVMLDPIETGGWLPTLLANGTSNCRAYGQYLGNRYKNFPNIIWSGGNDFQNWSTPANDAVVLAVASGIQDEDTNHLQTIELDYFLSSSLDDPNWAPIVGLNAAYTYSPTYAEVLHAYNQSSAIPTFMTEANYEYGQNSGTDGGSTRNLRLQEYWTMLSGATGQLYGNHYTWRFLPGWQGYLDSPGMTQLGYMANLFGSRAWYNLVPDQAHTFVTGGYGNFTNGVSGDGSGEGANFLFTGNNYVTAALTPDGSLGMAYLPQGGTITVAMTQLQNTITARWFDPSANTFRAIAGSPFSNTGTQTFTPPGNNSDGNPDWVLVLEANFVDMNWPTLSITNVTAGMSVSNAAFTVKGIAGDNVAVSNVYYSLNNTGWSNGVTDNNWTNWTTAVLMLTPGTNTIAAYAVDTSGNVSTTNTVSFDYVPNAILTVSTNGVGSLSTNYSGASLQVGNSYAITATAGTGFVFTNWTGGTGLPLMILTNVPTVQFVMAFNLVLQANFVDTTKPAISITNVTEEMSVNKGITNITAGMSVSNVAFTVKGTASDNWQVINVFYSLNSGGWSNAVTADTWTNWSATVNLTPGTNTISAYAVDPDGDDSLTNTVKLDCVVSAPLTVQLTGRGTLTPNYSNVWLELGRNYSITATPATGFVCTNWVISTDWLGGVVTNSATVQFMMQSNLTLQVNFAEISKPTLTITAPTAGQHMTNALAYVKGTTSDNWNVSDVWYQLNNNAWSLANTTNVWTNWGVTLPLVSGTNLVKAYALDLGGNFSTTNSVSFVSSNAFELQLVFTTAQPLATNGLNLALQVSTGLDGQIQVSTNLVDWLTLTNFIGTNSIIDFQDAAATNFNLRFYRAVAQ